MAALHHVEACVRDGAKFAATLTEKYCFNVVAVRHASESSQWLMQKDYALFLITQSHLQQSNRPVLLPGVDTFNNIAIQVKDIDACLQRLSQLGGGVGSHVLIPKTESHAGNCYAKISTLLGNLTYTLITPPSKSTKTTSNKQSIVGWIKDNWCYAGFKWIESGDNYKKAAEHFPVQSNRNFNTYIDHITLVCNRGETDQILQWHEAAFGMHRFFMNTQDSPTDGFVVQDESSRRVGGLKLKAMEYFHCSETGLFSPQPDSSSTKADDNEPTKWPLRIVIAESLPGQGLNQIDAFLEDHGCGGIQHIGLHHDDIIEACRMLTERGVEFQKPPAAYYTQPDKVQEIAAAATPMLVATSTDSDDDQKSTVVSCEAMQQYGILIDSEADAVSKNHADADISNMMLKQQRYLLQVFSRPLFDNARTFFLELLQRHGATGFGTGNIKALWKSVQLTLEQQEEDEKRRINAKN